MQALRPVSSCMAQSGPIILYRSTPASQFFTELSKRGGNPIYNLLPDTLSCLSRIVAEGREAAASSPPGAVFDQAAFRTVVKYLLGFINKDKHADALAEKLLHRLAGSGGTKESSESLGTGDESALWRDVAFCLGQLPLNEKVIRKLAEGVRLYQRCLGDDDVWESFSSIAVKARRATSSAAGSGGTAASAASGSKVELRTLIDEWERALGEARATQVEDDAVGRKATAAAQRAALIAAADGVDVTALVSGALAEAEAARNSSISAAATALLPSKNSSSRNIVGRSQANLPRQTATGRSRTHKKAAVKTCSSADEETGHDSDDCTAAAPPRPRARAAQKRVVSSDSESSDVEDRATEATVTAAKKLQNKSRKGAASASGGAVKILAPARGSSKVTH